MTAAIIILSIVVLFLAVSLGVSNTRRGEAQMAYHIEKGTNNALTAQNETLVQQATELYDIIQKERAAHASTVDYFNGVNAGKDKWPRIEVYKYIAVDFDGTLCAHEFPEIGEPKMEMIGFIREKHAEGTKIILYTCRDDREERAYLQEAVDWCKKNSIPIDAVNENPWVDFGKKKIYADLYIDDRAVSPWEALL